MQLNWNPLNVINKTIKNIFQTHNSEQKSKELEPLKVFVSQEKGVPSKQQQSLQNQKDFRGQIRKKTKG